MRTMKEERKLSIYFPTPLLKELNELARRLDRSKSWLLQKAWKLSRQDLKSFQDPYPPHLVSRFQRIAESISETTKGLSDEEIEQLAVGTIKKVRKKAGG